MASPSPTQLVWRSRLETVLRIVEPGLNLMLAAGDRISRVADRDALDSPPPARRVGDTGARRVSAASEPGSE